MFCFLVDRHVDRTPQTGMEPISPALEREILTLDCQGSPLYRFYNTIQNSL